MRDSASDSAISDIDVTAADLAAVGQPALLGCDGSGVITFADAAIGQLLGVDPAALVGMYRVADLLDAGEVAARAEALGVPVEACLLTVARAEGRESRSWTLVDVEGGRREILLTISSVSGTGPQTPPESGTWFVLAATDRTPYRRAAQTLRAQERFRGAFQDAPIAMAVVDVDERLIEVNDALCDLTGLTAADLEGRSIDELTVPDEADPDPDLLPVHGASGAGERKLRRADGGTVWVSVHVRLWSAEGQPTRLLLQLTDISERKHYETQLRHLGEHDPLTGLANRRQLSRELERHVARVHRHGPTGAVLLLDLDQFKMINDTMGHSAGDRVIVGVATALRRRLRASDLLARLGGDEFAVLLSDVDPEQAVRIAQDLAECLAGTRIRLDEAHSHNVTTSVGVATFEGDRVTVDEVLARADAAMYQAKDEGPGRVCRFRPSVAPAQRTAVSSAERGRVGVLTALRSCDYRVMAQPIRDLRSGSISHYELLVRLRVGDRLMLPSSFLPTATRHGLIGDLDRWVFGRAVEMLRAETLGDATLCINIDGRSLDDAFAAEIERKLPVQLASRLVFEVTETSGLSNLQAGHDFMSRVRSLGSSFAIDDFGAGFGSLHHLRQLPFDYLKIDGEFVRRAAASTEDQVVVGSLVSMARGLGMQTVAECVEDPATLRLLHVLGVDFAQGWHVGYPGEIDLDVQTGPVVDLAPSGGGAGRRG
jgi:diguanylate cyclase (GGDEF)-like protein/PAS domain S-box-containing protein